MSLDGVNPKQQSRFTAAFLSLDEASMTNVLDTANMAKAVTDLGPTRPIQITSLRDSVRRAWRTKNPTSTQEKHIVAVVMNITPTSNFALFLGRVNYNNAKGRLRTQIKNQSFRDSLQRCYTDYHRIDLVEEVEASGDEVDEDDGSMMVETSSEELEDEEESVAMATAHPATGSRDAPIVVRDDDSQGKHTPRARARAPSPESHQGLEEATTDTETMRGDSP